MSFKAVPFTNLGGSDVRERESERTGEPPDLIRSFAKGRKRVAGGVAIWLLIGVGLVLYVAGIFCLKSIVIPADLPAFGQFFKR
jgi:hypothetical protein